jgi:hypothetical protein
MKFCTQLIKKKGDKNSLLGKSNIRKTGLHVNKESDKNSLLGGNCGLTAVILTRVSKFALDDFGRSPLVSNPQATKAQFDANTS